MKAKLTLNNSLWQTPERRLILDSAVQQSGAELESLIKQKILSRTKSGKVYRRGAIKKKIAKKDLAFYRSDQRIFKRTFSGLYAEKTTVGYQFHRASKKGESPASDSGSLANSVRARGIASMRVLIAVGKRYGKILDDKNKLDRPFFKDTVEKFREKFKSNISKALDER